MCKSVVICHMCQGFRFLRDDAARVSDRGVKRKIPVLENTEIFRGHKVYALATGAGSPRYTLVPRAGSPRYTSVIGLAALGTHL